MLADRVPCIHLHRPIRSPTHRRSQVDHQNDLPAENVQLGQITIYVLGGEIIDRGLGSHPLTRWARHHGGARHRIADTSGRAGQRRRLALSTEERQLLTLG